LHPKRKTTHGHEKGDNLLDVVLAIVGLAPAFHHHIQNIGSTALKPAVPAVQLIAQNQSYFTKRTWPIEGRHAIEVHLFSNKWHAIEVHLFSNKKRASLFATYAKKPAYFIRFVYSTPDTDSIQHHGVSIFPFQSGACTIRKPEFPHAFV